MSTRGTKLFPNSKNYKRATRACTSCNYRRVRCDGSITGFPCTNCRLDEIPCTPHFGNRDKARREWQSMTKHHDSDNRPTTSGGPRRSLPWRANAASTRSRRGRDFIQGFSDILTKHYFLYVHPCLPVVDEEWFWRQYRRGDGNEGKVSQLLFQAMLFAASSFVPLEVVKRCGYQSLVSAQDDLYQRAQRFYSSGVEMDSFVISQACLLLAYYTTAADPSTNSRWLRIAIQHAKRVRANLYYCAAHTDSEAGRKKSELKRLWWCCIIRDRIISLGMRRPIQITRNEFDFHQPGLSSQDLKEECAYSEVYPSQIKVALCCILESLCYLVVAVTDLIMLVYPPAQNVLVTPDYQSQINLLELAKLTLLDWELTWNVNPDGKEYYIHPSITLFTNICAIYYQSARIALNNRICILIGCYIIPNETQLSMIESCRSDIAVAIISTADNMKQIVLNGLTDKLPASVIAYILFPQILLSLQIQLATSQEDKELNEIKLVFFVDAFRCYRARYHMELILAVSEKALEICQSHTEFLGAGKRAGNDHGGLLLPPALFENKIPVNDGYFCYVNLFQLRLPDYIQLLSYIDGVMSQPHIQASTTKTWVDSPTAAWVDASTVDDGQGRRSLECSASIVNETLNSPGTKGYREQGKTVGRGILVRGGPATTATVRGNGEGDGDSMALRVLIGQDQILQFRLASFQHVIDYLPLFGE
ncbi:fungal-specific transcription factor domain-containing protein [Aspergillus spectabilis]